MQGHNLLPAPLALLKKWGELAVALCSYGPVLKFIYSEKAKNFCEISIDLPYVEPVKSMLESLQNFVAFSEYMNFTYKAPFGRAINYEVSLQRCQRIFLKTDDFSWLLLYG